MKHQSVRDRLNEGEGEVKHHLRHESDRHMERIHHEKAMHEHHSHALYRHEEERPKEAPAGHMLHGMGVDDMKGEAMGIAYGQAGKEGCASDMRKIHEQFKNYHWEGSHGASGY